MLPWEEVLKEAELVHNKLQDPDVITCPKCGSDFFSAEPFRRYRIDTTSGLCQQPPPHPGSPTFWFLRCICGEVIEPPLSYTPGERLAKMYQDFINKVKTILK